MTPTITQMAISAETSVGMSVVIGPSWKLSGTDLTMPLMSPPKKNWNVYWNPEMWWKSRLGAVTI